MTTCSRHPEVETELRCGRCETLICPRCLVYTPGGTRCPDCAQLRRPPMYELAMGDYVRAVAVAVLIALPLGYVGALLLPPRPAMGFFVLIIAAGAGWGAGTLIAMAISKATNGKRGGGMQAVAAVAIVVAAVTRIVLVGFPLELLARDLGGFMLVIVALSAATGRLR